MMANVYWVKSVGDAIDIGLIDFIGLIYIINGGDVVVINYIGLNNGEST